MDVRKAMVWVSSGFAVLNIAANVGLVVYFLSQFSTHQARMTERLYYLFVAPVGVMVGTFGLGLWALVLLQRPWARKLALVYTVLFAVLTFLHFLIPGFHSGSPLSVAFQGVTALTFLGIQFVVIWKTP